MNTTTSLDIGDRKEKLQPIKVEAWLFCYQSVTLGFSGIIPIFCRAAAQAD
jgi:hypothetical protein